MSCTRRAASARRILAGETFAPEGNDFVSEYILLSNMTERGDPVVEGYCGRCDERVRVYRTVPWQDDICVVCGSPDVDTEASAT